MKSTAGFHFIELEACLPDAPRPLCRYEQDTAHSLGLMHLSKIGFPENAAAFFYASIREKDSPLW